jgi:hypothetical protein
MPCQSVSPLRRVFYLTCLLAGLSPWLAFAAGEGALAISAADAASQRSLGEVEVTVESRDGQSRTAVTASDGSARIEGLEGGFYMLRAERTGYIPVVEHRVRIIERRSVSISLELIPLTDSIEEVVVTARARQVEPFGSVAETYLNRDELRNAPGSGSDVMRAMNSAPGVVSTGDEYASFSVRGHSPKDNLIFVDGFPIDQVVHFEATLGEDQDIINGGMYSIFAPNAITGAEFSPGGWSAQYGGRMASFLGLEVAAGAPEPVGSLRIDLAGVELLYEGPSGFHDGTSMFIEARRFDFGQLFEFIGEDDLGQPVATDVIFKTRTQLDDNDEFEFLAIYAPEEYDRNVENVLASDNYEDISVMVEDQDLTLVGGTWRHLFGEDGAWTNKFYYRNRDKYSSEGEAYPDLVPEGTPADQVPVRENLLSVQETETELGWLSDLSLGNRFGKFNAGLQVAQIDVDYSTKLREDVIRYVYRSTDPRPPGKNYIVLQPSQVDSVYSADEINYSLYGEQVFEWGRSNLRAGLRYDRDGFSDENLVSPRIGYNFNYSPALRLSATAGIFYESPRYLVRSANPGNFNIQNEEMRHVGLGFNWRFADNWNLLAEGYYQKLDKLIVAEGRTTAEVTNNGEGTNAGVDVVLSRSFGDGWSADMIYSWNRYRQDDNNGLGEYPAEFSRDHYLSIGGRWEINERWQIAARWKYGTGQPTDRYIVHEDVLAPDGPLRYSKELTELNTDRSDAFHSLDVRVDYRRPIGPLDMVVFLDVLNIYGGPSTTEPDFNIFTGQKGEEEEELIPLFGLIFEYAW